MTKKTIILTLSAFTLVLLTLYQRLSINREFISLPLSSERTNLSGEVWPKDDVLNTLAIVKNQFENNFFDSPMADGKKWLSVSHGAYNGQFYSRDTFVSLMGAVYMGSSVRNQLKDSIWWFTGHMDDDGYIPLWFRKTTDLNIYRFSPYDKTSENGGIKQIDHLLEYVDGVWLLYSWEGDNQFLTTYLPAARKVWKYLDNQTNNYLISAPSSSFAGLDWADKMLRGGKSTFVQAYWYKATKSLAYLEKSAGNQKEYLYYLSYADGIKLQLNKELWSDSKPIGYDKKPFGHFIGWVENEKKHDYFEVDSNSLAAATGVSDEKRGKLTMKFIVENYEKIVNKVGASRVLLGQYDKADMYGNFPSGEYQNGGFWYIVSYPVSKGLARFGYSDKLQEMLASTKHEIDVSSRAAGLAEWYKSDGTVGGAVNYSWSLAYPYYLVYNAILGVETDAEGLLINPVLPKKTREVYFQTEYRGKTLNISIDYKKYKRIKILNKDLEAIKDEIVNLNYR